MAIAGLGGVGHLGIHVADIDRSLEFYCGLLGMELLARFDESDEVVRSAVGYPDASLKTAHLRIPESDLFMEVIEYVAPEGEAIDPQPANSGTVHLTFYVDDLQAAYDELVAAGVEPAGRVTDIPDQDRENGPIAALPHLHEIIGGRTCYMKDPDGIRVELMQRRSA